MRRSMFFSATGAFSAVFAVLAARGANAGAPLINYVELQPATPGTAQTGHLNITGTAKAALFSGSGANLLNLSANQLLSGTVPDARLSANVAMLNKNNVFNATQRYVANIQLLAQNGGIAFPTPTLNSAVPMINMGGDTNAGYSRMVLGHATDHPDWGLKYYGSGKLFAFQAASTALSVDLDGGVGVNTSPHPDYAFYVWGMPGANSAGRFYSNGATYALSTNGNAYVGGNLDVGGNLEADSFNCWGNLGIGVTSPSVDLAIDDVDTGFNGSGGALNAMIDGTPVVYIRAAGLGIGRSPTNPLDVKGKAVFRNTSDAARAQIFTHADNDCGEFWLQKPNGHRTVWLTSAKEGSNLTGVIAAMGSTGYSEAWFDVDPGDNKGRVVADIKNFREINPRDPKTDIYYASLEGPEAAMYIRGNGRLVNGRTTLELPLHFTDLANPETYTVQLTPASFRSKGLGYEIAQDGTIVVGELGDGNGNYAFSWVVTAVRKGYEDYEVIRSWKETPQSLTESEAWAARMDKLQKRRSKQP